MESEDVGGIILYGIGILLGLISIIMTYTGLPANYDTEPILGFGLLFVAIAGLRSIIR